MVFQLGKGWMSYVKHLYDLMFSAMSPTDGGSSLADLLHA